MVSRCWLGRRRRRPLERRRPHQRQGTSCHRLPTASPRLRIFDLVFVRLVSGHCHVIVFDFVRRLVLRLRPQQTAGQFGQVASLVQKSVCQLHARLTWLISGIALVLGHFVLLV